jgi:hypothetical protein
MNRLQWNYENPILSAGEAFPALLKGTGWSMNILVGGRSRLISSILMTPLQEPSSNRKVAKNAELFSYFSLRLCVFTLREGLFAVESLMI